MFNIQCHVRRDVLSRNVIMNLGISLRCCLRKFVEVEPLLIKLIGEQMHYKTTKIQDEARLDIAAQFVWIKGKKTFIDIRVIRCDTISSR